MTQPSLPTPILTTPRLHIRPYAPQDAPSISDSANTLSVAQYMTLAFPYPYTVEAAEKWINIALSTTHHHAITLATAPETVIGGIGLKPHSDVEAETTEIGYWLGEKCWGRGLMKEAVEVYTDWAFGLRGEREKEGDEMGWRFRKVAASVMGGNVASWRVLEVCGFVAEGNLKEHARLRTGELVEITLFGVTRSMWEERRMKGKE